MSRGTFVSVLFIGCAAVGIMILHDALQTQANANTAYSVKQNPIVIEPDLMQEIVGEFSTPEDAPPVPDPETHLLPAPVPADPFESFGPSVLVDELPEPAPAVTYERTVVRQSCRTYSRRTPVRSFIRRLRGR